MYCSQTFANSEESSNSWMPLHKHVWYHAQPCPTIASYPNLKTMDRPWSFMVLPCLFTGLPDVQFCCNNTLDKQIRQLLPINKNMTICEETRHRLYLFIKTTTTTDTTTCAHDTFCPLPQAWHVNCPFNCPITPPSYKHGVYTVLLVLKSGWW